MKKVRISCVSYLNSKPFIHGLQNTVLKNEIELHLDIPSVCAKKLEEDQVDIGLVPVAVLPGLEEHYIISEYCIGADGKVDSVLLLSQVPLDEIKTVLLDYQSRTSVMLARILAEKFWKINPEWEAADEDYENRINGVVAGVVIGDRAFGLKNKFRFAYDLSDEWKKFTRLPFVFACWVSNKKLNGDFIQRLNEALAFGLQRKEEVIQEFRKQYPLIDLRDYFENKVSYSFDEMKKKSLELFLGYVNEISQSGLMKTTWPGRV